MANRRRPGNYIGNQGRTSRKGTGDNKASRRWWNARRTNNGICQFATTAKGRADPNPHAKWRLASTARTPPGDLPAQGSPHGHRMPPAKGGG